MRKPAKKPVKSAKSKSPQGNSIAKKLNALIKSVDIRQLLIKNMAFLITGVIMWQIAPRLEFIPFPSWITGVLGGAGLKLLVYVKGKNAKKWRKDME